MMKKKSMAVAVAAVTVATSVAPAAFADTTDKTVVSTNDTQKLNDLKAQIQKYLDVKYVDNADLLKNPKNAGQGVYTVKANKNADATTPITEMKELDRLIANLEPNDYINISVVDNGSKTIDGNVVDYKVENYKAEDMNGVESAAKDLVRVATPAVKSVAEGGTVTPSAPVDKSTYPVISVDRIDVNTVSVELANNKTPLVIKTGDAKLDLSEAGVIYKQNNLGMYLDKDGNITKNKADYVVEGFKTLKSPLVAKADGVENYDYDATPQEFAIKDGDIITKTLAVNSLYDVNIGRVTSEGNKLMNYVKDYNASDKNTQKITANISPDGLTLIVNVPAENKDVQVQSLTAPVQNYATIEITGTSNEISAFAPIFEGVTNVDIANVTAAQPAITTIGGKNRQDTAIKVSQKAFTTPNAAGQNVVLVSDYAIADGLSATPFAKQNNAPILLTSKDSISDDVMKEIKRVRANDGKVFLIGGDAVLSDNIETQLYNAGINTDNIERIKGKNREETSLKIAEKMTLNNDNIYVTGGHAEADAMSIANIAANEQAPILLANQNTGLSSDQVQFIENNKAQAAGSYVIGGEAKVPATVETQLKDALNNNTKTVERLKGKNRQQTNAVVINKFVSQLDNLYVAKSDDKGLVDALPGGVLAGKANTAVVLATDEINADQKDVLENLDNAKATKTQVGYGVAANVWEAINAIFNK